MASILKSELLDYPDNIVNDLRKKYGLDQPGRLEEALDLLQDWYRKQGHFTKKDVDRSCLELCIVTSKGSLERAKQRLEQLCILKTVLPEFFTECKPGELLESPDNVSYCVLPKLDSDNNRVYIAQLTGGPYTANMYNYFYRHCIIFAEYLRTHEYCDGYVLILDYSKCNLIELLSNLNVVQFKNYLTILMKGYGMRLKGSHVLVPASTLGTVIDTLVGIVKSVVSQKVADRVHIHKKIETLFDHIPQDMLPLDYGGKEKYTVADRNAIITKTLNSKENLDVFNDMRREQVNKAFTQTDKFHEEHPGLAGSFRKLTVD